MPRTRSTATAPKTAAEPRAAGAQGDSRQRLVSTMARSMQRAGLNGTGLSALLAEAGTPKGVMYHHFPGGKTELALAAIEATTAQVLASLDAALDASGDPVTAMVLWIGDAQRRLAASGYERGCPFATVALETTTQDRALREALSTAFARIRSRLQHALIASGRSLAEAAGIAALMICAYEGALLQCRVEQDGAPLSAALQTLAGLLSPGQRVTTRRRIS